jgi:predicted metal-dependent phosphoesterase TrpH
MIIDLHIHTRISSPCSILGVEEMIERAKKIGLDALCVTEHDTTYGAKVAAEIASEYNFLVLEGMEVRTAEGDLLVFGWKGKFDIEDILPAEEIIREVHSTGGIVIPAHPFRVGAPSLRNKIYDFKDVLDAVETWNGNSSYTENILAQRAALKMQLPCVGGGDAHRVERVGRYATIFESEIRNLDDFMREIRRGNCTPAKLGADGNFHSLAEFISSEALT